MFGISTNIYTNALIKIQNSLSRDKASFRNIRIALTYRTEQKQ